MVALKWASHDIIEYQRAFPLFAARVGIIDNHIVPVFNQLNGGIGVHAQPATFWPEWGVRYWTLLASHQWEKAQGETRRVILPYYEFFYEIAAVTCGESALDKLVMDAVGLYGGPCRPPIRPLPPIFKERVQEFCREVGVPTRGRAA